MTHTNETGTPTLRCIASAPMFSAARKSAETKDQTGLSFASSATAMPGKAVSGRQPIGKLVMDSRNLAKSGEACHAAREAKLRKTTR